MKSKKNLIKIIAITAAALLFISAITAVIAINADKLSAVILC